LTSIQGLLIAFLVVAAIISSFAFRAKVAYRLLAILLLSGAVVLVIFPNLTTLAAQSLGVGRGTDLLLYVSLITGLHVALMLYLRTRDLERKITEQARAIAIRNATGVDR
jgi:hypothetical protein